MKYFLDTEFLEGPQKEKFPISLFRKNTPPTIDLISIGIVAEDGREYYAVSKDFNLKEAWNRFDWKHDLGEEPVKVYWIRENVLKTIWRDLFFHADDCSGLSNKQTEQFFQDVNAGGYDHYFSFKSLKALIDKYGKTNFAISCEIKFFTHSEYHNAKSRKNYSNKPEFYAYFADYDWVVFCWIFGKMMDLPEDFPKYCRDLKQMLDEKAKKHIKPHCFGDNESDIERMAERSIKGQVESFKTFKGYPKQENEHNALADARWNRKLFDFLNKL